ncbi:hypothetical protein ACOTVE_09060 [Campylobacter jejuni]|uniref:hypothetical protein n=1 Tax=Campylobacter jejuni TaxID=197 RepID=UPI003BA2A5E4
MVEVLSDIALTLTKDLYQKLIRTQDENVIQLFKSADQFIEKGKDCLLIWKKFEWNFTSEYASAFKLHKQLNLMDPNGQEYLLFQINPDEFTHDEEFKVFGDYKYSCISAIPKIETSFEITYK